MKIRDRIAHAWNAFNGKDSKQFHDYGPGSSNPLYTSTTRWARSAIADVVYNRIATDASMIDIQHVTVDEDDQSQKKIKSGLQNCLSVEANKDQSGRDFIHDLVYSMFDEGVVAVVPIETTLNPEVSGSYDIKSMRTGRITQWYPSHVKVELYDDRDGTKKEIVLPKAQVAIIENPFYSIVNSNGGMLRRITDKMAQMDQIDQIAAAGNLNLILQIPYSIKNPTKKAEAEQRRKDLEDQLENNKYGVGYIDGTEKITQLNRPITTNLQDEVKYLTEQFYNALGLTQNVLNGTAKEPEMLAYYSRTIDPVMQVITSEFSRKFITKTGRTQGQTLKSYRNPFNLVPVEQLASIADTFTRNAILSSNEFRPIVGFQPRKDDPKADALVNSNIADVNQQTALSSTSSVDPKVDQLLPPDGSESSPDA